MGELCLFLGHVVKNQDCPRKYGMDGHLTQTVHGHLADMLTCRRTNSLTQKVNLMTSQLPKWLMFCVCANWWHVGDLTCYRPKHVMKIGYFGDTHTNVRKIRIFTTCLLLFAFGVMPWLCSADICVSTAISQ